MLQKTLGYTLLTALVGLVGCGSASGGEESGAPAADAAPTIRTEVLAAVDVGYGTVEFVKHVGGEDEVLGIAEVASAYAAHTPLDSAMGSGPHTLLELFIAIAPDQEPPAELVENHHAEAAALRRETDALLAVSFDADEPVEKSTQACRAAVYAPWTDSCWEWNKKLERTTSSSSVWLPVGDGINDWTHNTGLRVTMGVCNANNQSTWSQIAWDYTGEWQYGEWKPVAEYTWRREWGIIISGKTPRWGIHHAGGPSADLMSAELKFTGKCI